MPYAENTAVSVEKSRAEIETILRRYGAKGFQYAWAERDNKRIEQIDFVAKDRHIRFVLVMPSQDDKKFAYTPHRHNVRNQQQRYEAWEQACRQRWRALCLCIKAKLEAVDCGITQFDHEFMAQMVDPETKRTLGELFEPWFSGRLTASHLLGLPSPEDAFRDERP
jgi:hypothetical protein